MARLDDDVALDANDAWQQATWRIQRIAWLLMLLVVGAALTGLFGDGPLARTSARQGALSVEYARFGRRTAYSTLRITLDTGDDTRTRFWIARSYLESFEQNTIVPQPESITSSGDRLIYTFNVQPGSPLRVTFHLHAHDDLAGWLVGRAGVGPDGKVLEFRQFFYP